MAPKHSHLCRFVIWSHSEPWWQSQPGSSCSIPECGTKNYTTRSSLGESCSTPHHVVEQARHENTDGRFSEQTDMRRR